MLAFSNDYYGFIFRATQSVEVFCAYLKTGDVAKRLRVSENTVRDYVNRGWLACTVTPTGRRIFTDEDVDAFEKTYYERRNQHEV